MKVVCIDNSKYSQLEVGKVYEANLLFHEIINNKNDPFEWERNVIILDGEDDWFGTKL